MAVPGTSRLYRYAREIPGVEVVDMQYTTRLSSWFHDRAALRRLIAEGGYDIIHCNGSADHKQVMLATLGLRRRPRIVFTKHNDHPLGSLGNRLRATLATDHSIAVSAYVHGLLADSPYSRHPITTVRHGIDTDYYAPPDAATAAQWRERYFGPDWRGRLLLGSAGAPITTRAGSTWWLPRAACPRRYASASASWWRAIRPTRPSWIACANTACRTRWCFPGCSTTCARRWAPAMRAMCCRTARPCRSPAAK